MSDINDIVDLPVDDTEEDDLRHGESPPPPDEPDGSSAPPGELPPAERYEPAVTQQLADLGVDQSHASAALGWLRDNAGQTHELIARRDQYSVDVRGFSTDELGTLHHFLGQMHDEGIPQAAVESMLSWYRDARTKAPSTSSPSAVPTRDTRDKAAGVRELQRRWGGEYESKIADAQRYLDSLPRAQRDSIVRQTLPNGVRALNDPQAIAWLASQANAATVWYPNTARAPGTVHTRIAQIEAIMQTDRRRYNRDEDMQKEYRRLLAQREGQSP